MGRNRDELCLSSRYIHTGNSGVTLTVSRDVKKTDRAILSIRNGAFGAFSTVMEIRGNESPGMTSVQLRDLALMFMDAAENLDAEEIPVMHDTPYIIREDGYTWNSMNGTPPTIEDLLPRWDSDLNVRGSELVPQAMKDNPDLPAFYEAYCDHFREEKLDGTDDAGPQLSASQRQERDLKHLHNARRRRFVAAGVLYLRAWWLERLASRALAGARAFFDQELKKYQTPLTPQDLAEGAIRVYKSKLAKRPT